MDSSDQEVVSVVKIEIDIAEEPLSWTTQNEENGICEWAPSSKTASVQMTNKDYCKRWREAIRLDPKRAALQREKDIKRNRRNRRRPKTEEEKARINELARLRVAKSRARMKAKREAGLLLSSSAPSKSCRTSSKSKRHKDEEAVIALREKWREYKNRERSKWTAEKWQQHREKNKQAYHTRKAQIQRKKTIHEA